MKLEFETAGSTRRLAVTLLIAGLLAAGCTSPSSTSGDGGSNGFDDGFNCEQTYNDVVDAMGGEDLQTSEYKDNWMDTCKSQHGG